MKYWSAPVSRCRVVGTAPEAATVLLAFEGRPVSEIVQLFMKYSNNAVAESLVKAIGAQRRLLATR